jgi:hypothetical protein
VPHPRDDQQHQPDRRENDHYPQLPRHNFTNPYSPRSPA